MYYIITLLFYVSSIALTILLLKKPWKWSKRLWHLKDFKCYFLSSRWVKRKPSEKRTTSLQGTTGLSPMCPCSEVLLYQTVLGEVQKTLWAAQSCIVNEAAMDGAASWQTKSWLLSMVYYGVWYFFQHAIKLFSYMYMVYSNHATNTCVHVYVHTSLSSQTFSHFFGGWEKVWSDRLDSCVEATSISC